MRAVVNRCSNLEEELDYSSGRDVGVPIDLFISQQKKEKSREMRYTVYSLYFVWCAVWTRTQYVTMNCCILHCHGLALARLQLVLLNSSAILLCTVFFFFILRSSLFLIFDIFFNVPVLRVYTF